MFLGKWNRHSYSAKSVCKSLAVFERMFVQTFYINIILLNEIQHVNQNACPSVLLLTGKHQRVQLQREKWFIKGCLHLDQFVQKALSCSIISKKCCPQYKQVLALWPIYFLIFPECGLCLGITEYWIMKIENQ